MPPENTPGPARPPGSAGQPAPPAPSQDDEPVLRVRSRDDSDVGWGDRPEPDDDERLRRERPPHWDSA